MKGETYIDVPLCFGEYAVEDRYCMEACDFGTECRQKKYRIEE